MQQLQQHKIEGSTFAPSFNCYSSDGTTSTTITKVIGEEEAAPFRHESDDFEFSLSDEDASDSTVFPVFNHHDLLVNDDQIDASSTILGKLFIGESEESPSYSSSEADDQLEIPRKCKKSRSTGSGSKRWILFRYLLRLSNSQRNKPMVKKADSPKHKRNSGENSKFEGRWKAKTPVHGQFYALKIEEEKRRTYLPYRKDIVGLFANVNGMGKKMIPLCSNQINAVVFNL